MVSAAEKVQSGLRYMRTQVVKMSVGMGYSSPRRGSPELPGGKDVRRDFLGKSVRISKAGEREYKTYFENS